MKVQDVLFKTMAKKITWWAAAEIIGVTDRTMRRWRERLEEGGYAGLADRRKDKPSAQRIPLATMQRIDAWAAKGGHVVFTKRLPGRAPGLKEEADGAKIQAIAGKYKAVWVETSGQTRDPFKLG